MDYELLFEISKIDLEIMKLQKNTILKEKKKKLDILREEYNAIKKEYELITEESKNNTLVVDKMTKELESITEELEAQEKKLYSSNNMKTIDAYQKNIDKIKNDIKVSESHIYDIINKIQDFDTQKKELLAVSEKIKEEFNNLKTDFTDEKAATEERMIQLNTKRSIFTEKVGVDVLALYEEIKKSKGYGMAEVKGEICSGCGIGVPAFIINEAALDKKLVKCPNCERFIYIESNKK